MTPCPAGARSAPPYDDAVRALLARPLPARMRPGLFLGEVDGHGVVALQPRGWRALQRYAVWSPQSGRTNPPGLTPLRVVDLVDHMSARSEAVSEALEPIGQPRRASVRHWLLGVHSAIGLPAPDALSGRAPASALLVEPSARAVRRFDDLVSEEQEHETLRGNRR